MNRAELAASYTDALRNYIAKASESTLERAYELGRQAIESGLSSTDIVAAHHHALRTLELALGSELTQGRKERFLIESLGPLEMTRHGYIQANRDLQRLFEEISERTAELENANYELESFNYYISHDLRTSLQAVLGFSRTLESHFGGELSPAAYRCVEQISNGAGQMAELIDGLLSLAQIGGARLERRPVDIDALAHKAMGQLETQLTGRKIDVVYEDLPLVRGDPVLLERLLVNLLANAIKFTGSRKRAKIEIGSFEQDGERIIFVRDNGVGFDMKRARRLFGLFVRLHSAEEFEGTGIGLALANRVVARHGGRIWAEAATGKGATFYFTLEKAKLSSPHST
jgi:light-regulated signal transduction histidine kinase (bacteriophytochrome)